VTLYLVNCEFCHLGSGNQVRVNLSEGPDLYGHIVNQMRKAPETANCPIKTIVVPGHPEQSLLYLKLVGPPMLPANCGERMPVKTGGQKVAPYLSDSEIKLFYDWIKGGAVQ
jgi:hypothetical protein